MTTWRSYTDAERAEAVGLAMAIGAKRAGLQLGIPRRTISSWLQTPTPGLQAVIVRSRDDVASRLWAAVTAGTDAVLAGLQDPKARLGDKANALRIVMEAHQLITGGPTSRTETTTTQAPAVSPADRDRLIAWVEMIQQATDDELRAYLATPDGQELLLSRRLPDVTP